jgi:5-keto 4-deoxyuronate isomerase
VLQLPEGTRFQVLAPVVRGRKGTYEQLFEDLAKEGFARVVVDGEAFELGNKDCLYVTMGAKDVVFSGAGARFYLASCPAHKAFQTRKLGIAQANALERGSLE